MASMELFKKMAIPLWRGIFLCITTSSFAFNAPSLQLANKYYNGIPIREYWVSEKLDGVRAYWDGRKLVSRQGYRINAPDWFTVNFPTEALDGELWIGRGQFALVSGIVRQHNPKKDWQKVRYMVFDLPNAPGTFTQRLEIMKGLSPIRVNLRK